MTAVLAVENNFTLPNDNSSTTLRLAEDVIAHCDITRYDNTRYDNTQDDILRFLEFV